jgi:hypothetical protein
MYASSAYSFLLEKCRWHVNKQVDLQGLTWCIFAFEGRHVGGLKTSLGGVTETGRSIGSKTSSALLSRSLLVGCHVVGLHGLRQIPSSRGIDFQ